MALKTHTQMTIVALFMIAPRCEQLKYPSLDGQIDKMGYSHKIENCLAIQRNEALLHPSTWMNLKTSC